MKSLLRYEFRGLLAQWWFYLLLLITIGFGFVVGNGATISIGPDVSKNGTYSISLMVSFLSLFSIFFAGLFSSIVYFRESDHNFHLIYHALPINKKSILNSKIIFVTLLSMFLSFLLVLGFGLGQSLHLGEANYTDFDWIRNANAFIIFTLINTLFCVVYLAVIALWSKSKMMVYVGAILLYIFYMFMLIFTGSPLMTKGMPPSELSVFLTSLFDPFGMSGFFDQTSRWNVEERNFKMLIPQGLFLVNRFGYIVLIVLMYWWLLSKFDFLNVNSGSISSFSLFKSKKNIESNTITREVMDYKIKPPSSSLLRHVHALLSTTKIDLTYIVKSIPFLVISLGFLFYVSMEIYGAIEKGVRLPQLYASSGIMASTIIQEFNPLCLIAVLFYTSDVYWRSKSSNFYLIESATWTNKFVLFLSKWLSIIMVILCFNIMIIILGLIFQFAYSYPYFDWAAYVGIFIFVVLRMVAIAGLVLWIQMIIPHKIGSLVISALTVGFIATSLGNRVLDHPLFECFMPFAGKYSDMNSYGPYLQYFTFRYGFAISIISALIAFTFMCKEVLNTQKTSIKSILMKNIYLLLIFGTISISSFFLGKKLAQGYITENKELAISKSIQYEKQYRRFYDKPQPTVTSIVTSVDLFPAEERYTIEATYVLKNKTQSNIDSILINFPEGFVVDEASIANKKLTKEVEVLAQKLAVGDSLEMKFKMNYQWHAVNGHQSFNAIISNGSFMRISRYYPQIGYQIGNEIEDEKVRKDSSLLAATPIRKWDAPKTAIDDFITLDMTIATDKDQTAIGVGELINKGSSKGRNTFRYKTSSPIPFRFGISSAKYAMAKEEHKGRSIEVYYHLSHHENVAHIISNAKQILDYCEKNFGPYPFNTLRFAEISGFTKGFAATAYPATIFVKEDMIFHANIQADRKQDVINELAAHELSHMWWGNNQIAPDAREGEALLTESLAMYTELMLSKEIYGHERMIENVNLHRRMYLEERGYSKEQPLISMLSENSHLSYYKGLVVMYQLSQKLGEDKLNQILKSFYQKHKYPSPRPISIDLVNELLSNAGPTHHDFIKELFMKMVTYSFEIKKEEFQNGKLALDIEATKIDKDDNGKEIKLAFNGPLEIGMYYGKIKSPKIYRVFMINGHTKTTILLNAKPDNIVLDPYRRYL